MLRLRMLGPLELIIDGRPVRIGTPRNKALLGYLLWQANRVISTDGLVEALWGGTPPSTALAQIRADISALRRTLRVPGAGCVIESQGGGYVARINASHLDYLEFIDLVERGRSSTNAESAAQALRSALAMWRGSAFADVRAEYAHGARAYLDELMLRTHELLADLELDLGRHFDIVAGLSALVTEHPLRERLRMQLMLALHRCGRTAEALASGRDLRKLLADQHGLDPGKAVTELEQQLLHVEPSLDLIVPSHHQVVPRPVPAQLPAPPATFIGRHHELSELDRLLSAAAPGMPVTIITGSPGAGKTTLAVHWAHRVSEQFPDGHLYVNLRGFDPVGAPVSPAEAMRCLLIALGTAPASVPADIDTQAGLYRSLTSGRRILVVLDNARDEQQVRPLLPGTSSAAVLITSRRALSGLIAADGSQVLPLGLLSPDEAREMLIRRLDPARVAAEPDAVADLAEACVRLPLALSVVASRATTRPNLALRSFAADLRVPANELNALASTDITVDVRSVFAASYRELSPAASELFRRLSLHTGADIGLTAAASLAGQPESAVCLALSELTDAHLVVEAHDGRYTCHDLLRAYAAELAQSADSTELCRVALHRMVDSYLHAASPAATLLNPHRDRLVLIPPRSGVVYVEPVDRSQAVAWFAAEYQAVLAAVVQAAQLGLDRHAWQLASATATYLDLYGYWHDWITVQRVALAATERLADRHAQANVHHSLAIAYNKLGRDADTDRHLGQAIATFTSLDDRVGQAQTLSSRSRILWRRGSYGEGLDYARRALELFTACGDLPGLATAHNAVSACLTDLGQLGSARWHALESLRIFQLLDDRRSEADAWDSVGYVHHRLGEHTEAIRCFDKAHDLWYFTNDRLGQALALGRLGDVHYAMAEPVAFTRWEAALHILVELNHPEAAKLHSKLKQRQPHF